MISYSSELARQLDERIDVLNIDVPEVARLLKTSSSQIWALLNGHAKFFDLSEQKLRALSELLDVPYVSVLILAGKLEPQDFLRTSTLAEKLEFVFQMMSKDQDMVDMLPPPTDWAATPDKVRLLVALMYERILGKELLARWPQNN